MQEFLVCWGPSAATGAAPTGSQPTAAEAPALPTPSRSWLFDFPSTLQAITTALLWQFIPHISPCPPSRCQALPQPSTSDYEAGTKPSAVTKAGTGTHLSAALGGFHPNRGANSSAQPPSCSLGLRFWVATREGGGRGPGSDNGPQQSQSTGPVRGSSCPSTPLPKPLPQADRSAWPSTVFWPRRRKVLVVSGLGPRTGVRSAPAGLSPCPPGPRTPAPACKEFSVPGMSFYKASPFSVISNATTTRSA